MTSAILVFVFSFLQDVAWAQYIFYVAQSSPMRASALSAVLTVFGLATVVLVVATPWALVPALLGAFLGTLVGTLANRSELPKATELEDVP